MLNALHIGVTMRTLDKSYLASNPTGDEKAEITLSAKVPDKMQLAKNPDGTDPRINIVVKADTYMNILATLTTLHDDNDPLIMGLIMEVLTEEELASFASLEEAGPLIKDKFAEVVVPFKTWTVTMSLNEEEDVDIAITAPSAKVGLEALHYLTKPNMLTNTAIALCPETDDEDEDEFGGNEVLVVG